MDSAFFIYVLVLIINQINHLYLTSIKLMLHQIEQLQRIR